MPNLESKHHTPDNGALALLHAPCTKLGVPKQYAGLQMYDGLPVRHFSDGLEVHPTPNYRTYFRTNPKLTPWPRYGFEEN